MNLKRFLKERVLWIVCYLSISFILNVYLFCSNFFHGAYSEIFYLNFLILICYVIFFIYEYKKWKERFLDIYIKLENNEDILNNIKLGQTLEEEIIKNILIKKDDKFNKEYNILQQRIMDSDEYIAKWVHEIKVPISVLNMLIERIDDFDISDKVKNETEKINFLVTSMLYGIRNTSSCEDIFVKEIGLENVIKKSIKDSSFLLIKNRIDIKLSNLNHFIYTDSKWITYVLNQIINNSIKYIENSGKIEFYAYETDECIILNIKDNGIGIKKEDIKRVFDKGFTGNNGRINVYKSTGMGLYFSKNILNKLGHKIEIESEEGKGTEIKIYFYKISDYFNPILDGSY